MHNGMLDSSNVNVNRHHLGEVWLGKYLFWVFSIHKTQEVPAWIDECVHSIGLAFSVVASAFWASAFFEFVLEKWVPIVFPFRQNYRQLLLGNRHDSTFFTVYDWNRASPKSLPGYQPILYFHLFHLFCWIQKILRIWQFQILWFCFTLFWLDKLIFKFVVDVTIMLIKLKVFLLN